MEAFEIEPSYDREDPFGQGPRVLWGRVAILAGVVVFAFLIGRVTGGGGGGTSSATTATLQTKINTLQSENSRLSAALAASNTGNSTGTNDNGSNGVGTNGGSTTPTSTTTSPSPPSSSSTVGPNGTTYQVRAGDSLSTIEAHFYHAIGEQYTAALEQVNGLSSSAIHTGQTLQIPPASSITSSSSSGTTTSPSPAATGAGTSSGTTTHPTPTKK